MMQGLFPYGFPSVMADPQCPLWVISGHPATYPFMSAIGGKADIECPLFESEAPAGRGRFRSPPRGALESRLRIKPKGGGSPETGRWRYRAHDFDIFLLQKYFLRNVCGFSAADLGVSGVTRAGGWRALVEQGQFAHPVMNWAMYEGHPSPNTKASPQNEPPP
jgi:hypothetical protein